MANSVLRERFQAGETIIRAGEEATCAFIIEYGAVEIVVTRDGAPVTLARRGPGEIFGEMAIVDSKPRSASVVAVEDCQLLLVSKTQIQARIASLDPVMEMVLNVILARFRETVESLGGAPRSVTGSAASPEQLRAVIAYADAMERIELEQTVRFALEQEQLSLFYQPIVGARCGRAVGFEALARWRHPKHGLVSPQQFMPAVEDGGLMADFTRWALSEAAAGAARLSQRVANAFVAVNVAASDLYDPWFASHLETLIAQHELRPGALEIEITESNLVADPEAAVRALGRLRALGVSISVDDFGTGYSNLSYLLELPLDKIKIDRSFSQKVATSERDARLVEAIAHMGHALGLSVLAEGVETAAQEAALRDCGCDYLQGYRYGKPAVEILGTDGDAATPAGPAVEADVGAA